MSYDIRIKNEEKPLVYAELKNYINSLPNITDQRLKIGDDYYMEIYLEFAKPDGEFSSPSENGPVNCINLSVPYAFMDKLDIDHEVYHQLAQHLADYMHTRAYDLQLDIYLDEPSFQISKRRGLLYNIDNYYDVIEYYNDVLTFIKDSYNGYYPLSIDLTSFSIIQGTEKIESNKQKFKEDTSNHTLSPDKKLVAVKNRSRKSLKVFPASNDTHAALPILDGSKAICDFQKCGEVYKMRFSDNSHYLFTISIKSKTLKRWDCSTGKLDRNYSGYGKDVAGWIEINDNLLCTTSGAGVTFSDCKNGKIIVHAFMALDNWVVFTPKGDYEFKNPVNHAIELQWIDNANNESYCFIPGLGFAYMQRRGRTPFKLTEIKEARGEVKTNLLYAALKDYL